MLYSYRAERQLAPLNLFPLWDENGYSACDISSFALRPNSNLCFRKGQDPRVDKTFFFFSILVCVCVFSQ